MRMWNVNPVLLCRKHLSGEHVEMHMFVGTLKRGTSVDGYITDGLLDLERIKQRHDEVAAELVARGHAHETPMDYVPAYFSTARKTHGGDPLVELVHRCVHCRERIEAAMGFQWPHIPYGGDALRYNEASKMYYIQLAGAIVPDTEHPVRAKVLRKMELMRRDRQGMRKLRS